MLMLLEDIDVKIPPEKTSFLKKNCGWN